MLTCNYSVRHYETLPCETAFNCQVKAPNQVELFALRQGIINPNLDGSG